jgi:hypothetical protein
MVLAFTCLTTSCQKSMDYHKEDPKAVDSYKGNQQVNDKTCQISRISVQLSQEGAASNIVYSFRYNAAGDPVDVKNTAVGTGNPNAVFKYDNQHRLKEMIRPYDNGTFETWTKYFYNNAGQIVRDTQYIFGTYIDSLPTAHPDKNGFTINHFTYDVFGRVIERADSVFGPGPSEYATTTKFAYDTKGDLLVPETTFDSRTSLLRTNKIWMFICSNYSVNNGFLASAYSSSGLPISFPGGYGTMGPIITVSGNFNVEYACSVNQNGDQNDNSQN